MTSGSQKHFVDPYKYEYYFINVPVGIGCKIIMYKSY